MKKRWKLFLLSSLALAVHTPAEGQSWKYFDNHCRVGAVRTCASVRVGTTWDPVALVTRVQLLVRNLQGAHWNDNTGGAPITKIGLTAPKIVGASNLTVNGADGATIVGSPNQYWGITNKWIEGPVTFSATSTGAPEGGIQGCNVTPTTAQNYYRTCGDQGGWVVFSFTTTNQWDASASQIAWQVSTTAIDGKPYYACRSDDNPTWEEVCNEVSPVPPVTATPEPVSMALLGTGLLGIAGARRRKRLKDEAAIG